jgi:hypothetical protein
MRRKKGGSTYKFERKGVAVIFFFSTNAASYVVGVLAVIYKFFH